MSDTIDVQNVLAGIAASAIYPNGTGAASITGTPVVVYAGWPASSTLTADLQAGKCHVTVFPTQIERNVTRYRTNQHVMNRVPATITATVSGQTITFGGTVQVPQNIAIFVNGVPFTYAVQANDTLTSIATALATAISSVATEGCVEVETESGVQIVLEQPATSNGPVLTLGNTSRIGAVRIGSYANTAAEFKRQERVFMVTIWADTPAHRDTIGAAVDVALMQLEWLTMPDGYAARIIYKNSPVSDGLQKEYLYRRDLNYSVEFASTVQSTAADVVTITTETTVDESSVPVVSYY